MNAAVDRFVKFLVMECEDTEDTAFVDDLLAKAKEQITAGQGSIGFLTTGSANGKTASQLQQLTCDEVAYACRMALRQYANAAGSGPITFIDFSATR